MKIAIGYQVIEGPWGGGNRFVKSLSTALEQAGHSVVYDLDGPDIDIILVIDPRTRIPNIPFGAGNILRYLTTQNPNAVVVHRINECDERKGTRFMNWRLQLLNYCADHTVFVGSWLKDLQVWREQDNHGSSVILNGADTDIFHPEGRAVWDGSEPLKLVTHHWGGNWMKGFDIYGRLDQMMGDAAWKERIDFTYIGNVPANFEFANATLLEPMDAQGIANALRSHHVYVTGSINEPGGNHQNEGALCGLPLLYRNSGCMPEYCEGSGVMFNGVEDFEPALKEIMDNYAHWTSNVLKYPNTAANTIKAYVELFDQLYAERDAIVQMRAIWRSPLTYLLNQIPY
ncbi:hypothetical protein V5T82_08985 [Magnetovibrio sp. PR-2]|uniref:glycosyltransferase n=1 Tax=Magnetovibrio sp. PR-2 TaxID=3120356 RepID=UPI002FCE514B